MKFAKALFVAVQYILPHHLLSRAVGWLAETRIAAIKNIFISIFVRVFKVDLSEADEPNQQSYPNFNAFFVRELRPQARPLCMETDAVACPADGHLSEIGDIDSGRLIQAKGKSFQLSALLGGDEYMSQLFMGGKYATIYLSPQDYHRVHIPLDAQLQTMVHIPGRLFSVNTATTEMVDGLFARNERVVCLFDTSAGPMAVVLVGAMICASIETSWAGLVTPMKKEVRTIHYPNTVSEVSLSKGSEMGRFKLGSTVIVLFGPDIVEWRKDLHAQSRVRMGEQLGTLING